VHDASAAALADDLTALDHAVAALAELEDARREEADVPTGLVPYALDLRNATTTDPLEYEAESRRLLERDDLDPALRHRLEATVDDDERLLADERLSDAREARVGRVFNALVEPVGRSIMNGVMLPWRLARSISGLIVRERMEDELSLQERQALPSRSRPSTFSLASTRASSAGTRPAAISTYVALDAPWSATRMPPRSCSPSAHSRTSPKIPPRAKCGTRRWNASTASAPGWVGASSPPTTPISARGVPCSWLCSWARPRRSSTTPVSCTRPTSTVSSRTR
jgi:hypothetical protein